MSTERKVTDIRKECQLIEPLMFLKPDELSGEETSLLKKHLKQCNDCLKKNQDINKYLTDIAFQPVLEMYPDFKTKIESQIQNSISTLILKNKSRHTIFLKRALVAACILFFIAFSTEQLKTISKISNLENRVNNNPELSMATHHKGEILVINHFFSWDELVAVTSDNIRPRIIDDKVNLRSTMKNREFSLRKLSLVENRDAVLELIGKSGFSFPMIQRFESLKILNVNPQ